MRTCMLLQGTAASQDRYSLHPQASALRQLWEPSSARGHLPLPRDPRSQPPDRRQGCSPASEVSSGDGAHGRTQGLSADASSS